MLGKGSKEYTPPTCAESTNLWVICSGDIFPTDFLDSLALWNVFAVAYSMPVKAWHGGGYAGHAWEYPSLNTMEIQCRHTLRARSTQVLRHLASNETSRSKTWTYSSYLGGYCLKIGSSFFSTSGNSFQFTFFN